MIMTRLDHTWSRLYEDVQLESLSQVAKHDVHTRGYMYGRRSKLRFEDSMSEMKGNELRM